MEKKYQLSKDFAEKWCAALRSGEYKATKGVMYDNGCYCCLGVAEKICGTENGTMRLFGQPKDLVSPKSPAELQVDYEDTASLVGVVARMNDTGYSFSEIADWIERNCEFI